MTLEERLSELESMIAALCRDMKPERKFQVGDRVLIPGRVVKVDSNDDNLTYEVKYPIADDHSDSESDEMWFKEDDLIKG